MSRTRSHGRVDIKNVENGVRMQKLGFRFIVTGKYTGNRLLFYSTSRLRMRRDMQSYFPKRNFEYLILVTQTF